MRCARRSRPTTEGRPWVRSRDDFDLELRSYFDEAAAGGTAEAVIASVSDATRRRRSRPAWAVALRGTGLRRTRRVAGQPVHLLAWSLLLVGLLLALLAVVILGGGRERRLAAGCDAAWCETGGMGVARGDFTATALRNDKVLVAGGRGPRGVD